jgi:PAS domain S-box-containing protein
VRTEGWKHFPRSIARATGALIAICHVELDTRWVTDSWLAEPLRVPLSRWDPPAWRTGDAPVRQALTARVCLTEPLFGLSAVSGELSEEQLSCIRVGALIGVRIKERASLVVWLGLPILEDLVHLRGLADMIEILGDTIHRRYRDFFENIPVVFLAVDAAGTILDCNKCIQQLGYEPEELIGRSAEVIYAPGERERIRAKFFSSGMVHRMQVVLLHKNGSRVFVEITGKLLLDEQGRPTEMIGIGDDLRPVREFGNHRRLEAVNRIISGVAHELNNPLQTVVGNAELLKEMKLDADAHRRTQRVLAGAYRCQEVVDGMFKLHLKWKNWDQDVDLLEVLQNCVKIIETEFERPKVLVACPAALPIMKGKAGDLEQVFINLLRNAFQAAHQRSEPSVELTAHIVDECVQIVVKDNGPGMSEEVLDRAFDPFFTTREIGGGKGLGLSIVLGIIQEHGGRIELFSDKAGTRAVVTLPKNALPNSSSALS